MGIPHEQLGLQFGLQRLDLLGDGGLRNEQRLRRAGKAVAPGHGQYIADLSEFHGVPPRYRSAIIFTYMCIISEFFPIGKKSLHLSQQLSHFDLK